MATVTISVQRCLGILFVLGCLNSWTNFGTNNMDSQPWALLFGLIFIGSLEVIKMPQNFGVASILVVSGLLWAVVASNVPFGVEAPRAFASYFTYLIVILAFYNYLIRFGFPRRVILFGGFSWIAFGVVEIFVPVVVDTISITRTTSDRGFTSLAPEPTFFGIFLFFVAWMVLVASSYKPKGLDLLFVVVAISAIFLLAQSTMVVVYILIAVMIYFTSLSLKALANLRLRKSSLLLILITVLALPLVLLAISSFLEGSRLEKVFSLVGSDGLRLLIMADASINARVESSVISIQSFIVNFGAPGGLDTFRDQQALLNARWDGLFWYLEANNKILSWLGTWLHELGLFGLGAIMACLLAARRNATKTSLLIFVILSISAIPLAFPVMPMLLAMWMLPSAASPLNEAPENAF